MTGRGKPRDNAEVHAASVAIALRSAPRPIGHSPSPAGGGRITRGASGPEVLTNLNPEGENASLPAHV